MISKRFLILLFALVVLVGAGAVALVHLDNRRLRRQSASLRAQLEEATRLQAANERARRLVAQMESGEAGDARELQAALAEARARVNGLETRAQEAYRRRQSSVAAEALALATNHDPEKGLTRLENFRDVGQGTPAATFQTFVWAALQGEKGELTDLIAFDAEARARAETALATLPESSRVQFPNPEVLAALFFAAMLNGRSAATIESVAMQDVRHATVSVRGLTDRVQKVPMQLGPRGWQIMVPAGMADNLGRWAQGQPAPPGT